MLERHMFIEAMDLITKCLPTQHMGDRVDGLYHFFKRETFDVIRTAAQNCAEEQERFPTPAVFGRYVKACKAKIERTTWLCDSCNGLGMVTARNKIKNYTCVFRCHCTNASAYGGIPPWLTQLRDGYELVHNNPYQDLHSNPDVYERGIHFLSETLRDAYGKKMPNPIKAMILERIEKSRSLQKQSEPLEGMPF